MQRSKTAHDAVHYRLEVDYRLYACPTGLAALKNQLGNITGLPFTNPRTRLPFEINANLLSALLGNGKAIVVIQGKQRTVTLTRY